MAEREEDKNPFLIELVIANISKYLSFEELKVCRGLNHLWKETTNKMFLKLCPPIFLNPSTIQSYNCRKMTIPQFMKIYSDPNHPHPHAQLLRQYRNFLVFDQYCIPAFYNFLTEVGPQMTSLTLIHVKVLRNSQDLVDIGSSKYAPFLEELILKKLDNNDKISPNTLRIEGKENKHLRRLSLLGVDNRIQWLDVLSLYPKLKALSFKVLAAVVLEDIASALVTIRKADERKLRLTELDITHVYHVSTDTAERKAYWRRIEDLLKTANLPLENISLDGSISEISLALIQHYGENLKSLTLERHIPQPLPLMKALERMTVHECDQMTFLTKVPNIKSLCFYHKYRNNHQICFPESPPSPLVTLGEFNSGLGKEWNVTEEEKRLLWLPNVQNLKMNLNNTTFSWICQHFPNLKELTVLGDDLDDSGVVGEFDGALSKGCRPNITNLKALETFRMTDNAVFRKGLTEKSVFYGFSLMPKLSNVSINVKAELSADAMLALNRGIKNVKVEVAKKPARYRLTCF